MKKRYKRGILLSTLTTASLLVAGTGFAAFQGVHPDVPLLKWTNPANLSAGTMAVGQNDAYSPRATCGACHKEAVDDTTDNGASTDGVAQGSYHGGGATKTVVKTQGVQNQATDEVEWISFDTKAYKHGFVTGRHSQQGRNEDYGHHMRAAFGAKYFESSPGMFGKLCPPSNRQLAAKDVDPLANARGSEMGAQSFVESCGVCHAGGGQLEYDRDLNWYSSSSGKGDAFILKYAERVNPGTGFVNTGYVTPTEGYMSSTNKAEMDCLMCHLDGSNPGAAWVRTLGCGPANPIGPLYDPTCIGISGGHSAMGRTIDTDKENGVGEYDMFNRNFALKQYNPGLAASMGAGAKGVYTAGKLSGVDWGAAGTVTLLGTRIASTPKSENCSVCHARVDDTMGLPGMMNMRTGYGNFDLLYRPDADPAIPGGMDGKNSDLDTDNGATAANDDFFQDFGCKTGMGKRAHKVNAEGDDVGTNGKYGMTPLVPSTLDMNPATTPNPGDPIANKMPDIDVHNTAGMQCATCHYALGTDKTEGYVDIPARTVHGVVYPAERVYGMDHQFAQADDFPDTKSKNNLDNMVTCESCHIDRSHPNADGAPVPGHTGFPVSHLEKIGCVTCHIPEVYAAPGRLKYRDWSAGFWHQAQRNVLDWNFDLMTGSHNTVPVMHRWAVKDANLGLTDEEATKIYPVLPSVLPTWSQELPNNNVTRAGENKGTVCVNDATHLIVRPGVDITGLAVGATCDTDGVVVLYSAVDGGPAYGSIMAGPVKSRDATLVAEWVRDNGTDLTATGLGDGVCGPAGTCVGGVNGGDACQDRTDCTLFDIRVNGANTFPLFDGFQLADGLEIDTKAEVDAMLAAFKLDKSVTGADAPHTTFLNLVDIDFDVTHGIVPVEWALGGSKRGGCVSCHSSKDPMLANGTPNPNYNENSVGFFEGYVQPMDKAGMMVGGYDLIKNWTAMFADFDCTAFCGMGQKGDSDFFNPMTGEIVTGATCTPGSMFGAGATIETCVGMMTTKFDAAMGFPAGTAMKMGMYDGIAGLQGFTINTLQTMGSLECNPFGGPISFSPMPDMNGNGLPDGNVNSCMPAPTLSPVPGFDAMVQGTCNTTGMNLGATPPVPGKCSGGFRNNGACAADKDCKGAMTNTQEIAHNPMGLILSRKEVRSRQKIDLQQGYPGNNAATGTNNIRWAMAVTKNPGNPAHVPSWDQAEYCIDRSGPNPFKPGAISCRSIPYTQTECTDGLGLDGTWMGTFCSSAQSPDGQRHIMNLVSANQYLGYTDTKLAELMQAKSPQDVVHLQHLPKYACSVCHSDGVAPAGGTNQDYAVVPDALGSALEQFTFTRNAAGELATCTSQCHLAASAPAPTDVAIARISAQHSAPGQVLPAENFTVNLDGSKSACYHVDATTGVTTQGTIGYNWTFAVAPASTIPADCNAGIGGSATCRAHWAEPGTANVTLAVNCSLIAGLSDDTEIVPVTRFDVGAGVNDNPHLTAVVAVKTVTVKAPDLDTDVGSVTIVWADGTKSVVTATSTPSIATLEGAGVMHTYKKSGTYKAYVVTTNTGDNHQFTYPLTAGSTPERIIIP